MSNKVSTNFWRYEAACKCGCGFDTWDVRLIPIAELIRERVLTDGYSPSSVCRCYKHNEKIQKEHNPNYVAGSSKSFHLFGRAMDIVCSPKEAQAILDLLNEMYPTELGVGIYDWGVHVDTRTGVKARWDRRQR